MRKLTLLACSFLLFACASGPRSVSGSRAPSSVGPKEFAAEKLRSNGLNEEFIQLLLRNYHEEERAKVLDLNVLGFLRSNKATGEEKIPGWELARVQKFLRAHKKDFSQVEKKYQVPKEVIASLLWVETKHGKDLGTFHVGSALFSLLQADYPTITDQTVESARKKTSEVDAVMEAKIQDRCRQKAAWALPELKALQEIHLKGWKDISKLRGSFSGAFGMAQFLPSSYLSWAKGKKNEPNLFKASDSILSVGNYLQSNGWQMSKPETQEAALFHYNRDKAYVNHILKMSNCLKQQKKTKRKTASVASC